MKRLGRDDGPLDRHADLIPPLRQGWIAAVEAFDPALRDMPTDKAAPFIESMEFYPVGKDDARAVTKKKPSPKHERKPCSGTRRHADASAAATACRSWRYFCHVRM
jgi:hypothetical protein